MKLSLRAAARIAAVLVLASLATAQHSASAGESKIAIVDVQRAVMATEDGIRAQATMKKRFDKRQQELDAKKTELARIHDDIDRQARVMSREAIQRRIEDWQQQMLKLQTVFVEYEKELQKMQADLTGPIIKKIMAVIARVAKKNGYELILDKSAAPYVRQDLDLTDQVIQLYNSGGGDEGGGDEKKP
jgi:outer membrane protein